MAPGAGVFGDEDFAVFGGHRLTGLSELSTDVAVLDGPGLWVVVLPFEGGATCARFSRWEPAPAPAAAPSGGRPLSASSWWSSLNRADYTKGVTAIREAVAAGDVYQVNLCRRLSCPLPDRFDLQTLGAALAAGNPAPHAALVHLPSAGVMVASASPERFLRRRGELVESEPIKGTAASAAALTAKDRAENVMIVDLVRNDLGRVCRFGSVEVPSLCRLEPHPGLVHLVSTVRGQLRPGVGWADLLAATFPPGSVTGAPKLAALDVVSVLEPVPRQIYCGAVGWVDGDRCQGDLNVAIRTFWVDDGHLNLGTGAGITWYSDPQREWEESELKVRKLLSVPAG